jgi:hypothetical protein
MIGPMLHFNFGNEGFNVSGGIEWSYWNWEVIPYGVDAGIEYGGKKLRLYSELQTGLGLAGMSAGPVMQFTVNQPKINLGFQGSGWVNLMYGLDFRYRRIDGKNAYSPGVYTKFPFGFGFYDDYFDAVEKHKSSDHDFDWD